MVKQDTLWKGALETFFVPFLHFFFSDYLQLIDFSKPFEFLDKELEEIAHEFSKQEHRYVDKLVKVGFNSGVFGWILIHIEIQGYDDPYFAKRMFIYRNLIRKRYGDVPFTAIVVYTDSSPNFHPKSYVHRFMGTKESYEFNTYKLLEHPIEELERQENNPFALLLQVAWYGLKHSKLQTDEDLLALKYRLFLKLRRKGYSRTEIRELLTFIKYYVSFENTDYFNKFEDKILLITKKTKNMGIIEAVLADERRQGFEQKTKQAALKMLKKGYDIETITDILEVSVNYILNLRKKMKTKNSKNKGNGQKN